MADFKTIIGELDLTEVVTVLKQAGNNAISTKSVSDRAGNSVVAKILSLTAKGISPIRGPGIKRRFPAYRGSYKDRIRRGEVRGKRLRPVNLRLSGKFMRDLDFDTPRKKQGFEVRVGYFNQDAVDKELGHRLGTNRQAKRPTIPTLRERFVKTIEQDLDKIYGKATEKFLTKKLK